MNNQRDIRIVLIKQSTRLDELIKRQNTVMQAKFYIEHLGADFADYQNEHDVYYQRLNILKSTLNGFGKLHIVDRGFLPNYIFGDDDLVVVLGRDGLVANTLKYLNGQKIIGVNPEPKRWDGVLLPFTVEDLTQIIPEAVDGKRNIKEVTIAKIEMNNGQTLLAVNDFFIGKNNHTSARYILSIGEKSEFQSSSGIIVSTGLGSTGWFASILAGASGVVNNFSAKKKTVVKKPVAKMKKAMPKSKKSVPKREEPFVLSKKIEWDANYLYYAVREPFPSKRTGTSLVFGQITQEKQLKIVSQISENGVIFSDGIEKDYIEFTSGLEATVKIADKRGQIVV